MSEDPEELRARAVRWRKVASGYDAATAAAIIESAQALEDRAARIEAERAASAAAAR